MPDRPKILAVGSINMDICMEIPRFPLEGESVVGSNYHFIPGGKGANQAVAAALQGAEVYFLGKVGKDVNGVKLREVLNKKSVNTDFLFIDDETPSGLASVMVDQNGENRIVIFLASNAKITSAEIATAFENTRYDAMLIQFEVAESTVLGACKLAREHNIPIILDAGPAVDFPLERIGGMEILSPNQTEAERLSGFTITDERSAIAAARRLYERGKARYVVIKLGKNGALLYDGNAAEFFASTSVKAIDPTAAGDVFTAAMAVEYLLYRDIKKAVRYANVAGALAVTKLGAQSSIPTRAEVAAFSRLHEVNEYGC